jgi:hypothetical protein
MPSAEDQLFRALPQGIGRRIVDKSVRAAFFPVPKMNAWNGDVFNIPIKAN